VTRGVPAGEEPGARSSTVHQLVIADLREHEQRQRGGDLPSRYTAQDNLRRLYGELMQALLDVRQEMTERDQAIEQALGRRRERLLDLATELDRQIRVRRRLLERGAEGDFDDLRFMEGREAAFRQAAESL
jgi:hypothetical protein